VGILRVEVNGGPATAGQLANPAIVNDGHFTAMQVRGGAVRGLRLHLARLDSATRELFWTGLDGELVRAHVRHALGADARPSAPLLAGVTMQLVDTVLAEHGVPSR
jgi:branched-subunit amino acid aminotransferase/4-amino-4-deoxychorismate lyase